MEIFGHVNNISYGARLLSAGRRAIAENTIPPRHRSPRARAKPATTDGKPFAAVGTPEAIEQTNQIRNAEIIEKLGVRSHGFRNFGDYLHAVINAGKQDHHPDVRLIANAAPTTVGSEQSGADGGFAVPPEFVPEVVRKIFATDALLMMTDVRTTKSNNLWIPKDETTPWQTSGGIQTAWENEVEQLAQSKPLLTASKLRTNKLVSLVPVTDELAQDSVALSEHISAKAPEKINFAVERAIIAGSGVGQPLGIINSAGTVVVAEESSQTAGTINHANIRKLWRAVTPSARKNGVWLVHPDADEELQALVHPGTAGDVAGAAPLYSSPTIGAPYGSILGRPIYPSEACSALGSLGDIVFGDMSAYLTAVKALRSDVSIHLWFDYDITAFRFVLRIAGQPWTASLIPSLNGGASRGYFATLATRS